ncbi:hypothetical protein H5410_046929 [Solanum commersonii]|uniref:Uncharacterized protein n=1 Tax=Solanum commersonii TaxID=4109 RepID=A0A9J5XFS2_SOLCO|nr:hypothetical protein H5410_046929 [Solanum commersonii]
MLTHFLLLHHLLPPPPPSYRANSIRGSNDSKDKNTKLKPPASMSDISPQPWHSASPQPLISSTAVKFHPYQSLKNAIFYIRICPLNLPLLDEHLPQLICPFAV